MNEPLPSPEPTPFVDDPHEGVTLDPGAKLDPAELPAQDAPTVTFQPDRPVPEVPRTADGRSGRFRILRPHAKGGLGVVWVALDMELHREVALKEIQSEHADDPESRARFLLEGELTGRLEHPGVVPVYGLGEYADGRPFYAMRFIGGESLQVAIDRFHQADQAGQVAGQQLLAFRRLLGRFVAVCNTMAYVHSRGVIHRDLKPANVMLGPYGETLVVDWGLVKLIDRAEPGASGGESPLVKGTLGAADLTQVGTALGTPAFMSPEQAAGRLDLLGPASDTYSLGATLYYLLTGQAPFASADAWVVLANVQLGEFPPPRRKKPQVPAALEAICLKAMALKPEVRYGSAQALAQDIEHWLADEPVAACRDPWTVRLARWARRHKPVMAGAAALLIAAVLALAIGAALLGREQRRTEEQRDLAVAKSNEAIERAELLERQLYINRVNLAYRECLANNVLQAEKLLQGCPESRRGWEWSYCRRLCHQESLSIDLATTAHLYAHDLAFSPDHATIASANHDGTISFWDTGTGREVRAIGKHPSDLLSLAFSPDGQTVAVGCLDEVKLWQVRTGHEPRTLRGPKGAVIRVRFSPDGRRLAAASATRIEARHWPEVKLWEVAGGKELGSFPIHHWGALDVAFSPDGQQIATVNTWEALLHFHEAATGKEIRTVRVGVGNGNHGVAFAPDGKLVALACKDGSVLLWDVAANSLLRVCRGHSSNANSVAFSPAGDLAASASADGSVKLWEVATGRELANYRGHTRDVFRVCFDADGARLATLGYDPALKLWDVGAEPDVLTLRGHQGWAFRALFTADGQRLVTAGFNIVRVRDAQTGQTLISIPLPGGGVQGLALSPDGRQVATSGEFDQHFDLWDAATGKKLATLRGHTGRLRALAISPDGRRIASAGEDQTVRLWDVATGKEVLAFREHPKGVFGVTFSPDGRQVASISWDGTTRLWDAATGAELRSFAGMERESSADFGNAVAFSPDGRRLAALGTKGDVALWDVVTGQEVLRLAGHTRRVHGIAFSPDGGRLATASADNTLKLWDAATGEEVFTLRGHSDVVLWVTFSPDGQRLASASGDFTVKVWEAVAPSPEVLRRRHADPERLNKLGKRKP